MQLAAGNTLSSLGMTPSPLWLGKYTVATTHVTSVVQNTFDDPIEIHEATIPMQ
jgi:hypothetical protein